ICYLESDGHDTVLRRRDGAGICCKAGILQMEQELADESGTFFKPHRSYLVNLEYVERIGKKDVQMADGTPIPIARGKWEDLNRAYMKYYRRQCAEAVRETEP
ncbi:MAG: LytTR family transcriptional regulator, partial [Lachnospiraceae bacterium]|nr:LytTR family transcriptional regulator [Lachnospiraceae bacterium]